MRSSRRDAADRDLPHLMRSVIEDKRPIVVEQVTSAHIESLGQGPEHLQALLAAGVKSFVAVPLLMRGQSLGALFLGSRLSRVLDTAIFIWRKCWRTERLRNRECPPLPRCSPRHPTPRSGAGRRGS